MKLQLSETLKKVKRYRGYIYFAAFVAFLIVQYIFAGEVLRASETLSPLVYELFAAIIGSIITVGAMALMMRSQIKHETDKEYAALIFEKKLQIYQDLLSFIFSIDDDRIIEEKEIHKVENQIGLACLVANRELVSIFGQFMYQLKVYGVLYFRSMGPDQLQAFRNFVTEELAKPIEISKLADSKHRLQINIETNERAYFVSLDEFIQGLRSDLALVEGDVKHDVEHFVRTPINPYNLIATPNRV